MLKIHAKKLNAAEVLRLEGQIVNGETETLSHAMQLASGTHTLILDFSNVTVVDAHGLGVLLQLREQTIARGVHLELINLSKSLYRIFEITRLNTVFEINSDVQFLHQAAQPQRMLVAA